MADFAHFLDRMLHGTEPYLIAVAVILWVIAFATAAIATWRRRLGAQLQPPRIFFRAATGFLVLVLSICAAGLFISHAALDELRPILNAPVTDVLVDGTPIAAPEPLLAALRRIESRRYHHSHPTGSYRVQLQTSEGPLELILRRDSAVPNEYWVYYRGFKATEANDIGTVVTDALDGR
jgi:hypothetical protein